MKALILAGGGGTRLWPLSTPKTPKQFHKLVSNKTMIEETVTRLNFLKPSDIYIAINKNHLSLTKKLCPLIPSKNIIIEPALRDTASCIGLATAIIAKKYPNEVIAIIYADHLIKNSHELKKNLLLAEKLAKTENTLNIVEVAAKEPNTNYGYVKIKTPPQKINGIEIFNIDSFVEKPNILKAKKFVKSGKYLWNTGIYVWKAKTILEKYKKYKPETYKKLIEMSKNPKKIKSIYPSLEKISIDYALMEKINPSEIRVLKADLGWSDIGNYEAIFNELAKNKKENITRGEVKLIDCQGCLIYSDNNKKIAGIGLKDMVIIDTKDGQLICNKKDSKRTKELSPSI